MLRDHSKGIASTYNDKLESLVTLLQQQAARIADLRSALADCGRAVGAAALRVVAAQMIRTDDLTDTLEDEIRGAERQHQAGWLCTMAAELEGPNA